MTEIHEDGITVEKQDDKVNIILDMSKFDTFLTCPAKFNMRYNMQRDVPIVHKSEALDRGSLVHEGFEIYYSQLKNGIHYNDRMQASLFKMSQYASNPEVSNTDPNEVQLILKIFEECCDYWRFEDEQMEILDVEQAFAYVLYEDEFVRIIISGKIDLLVNIPAVGGSAGYTNLPIDHKTYKRSFELLRLSNQFQNYAVACNSNYLVVNRVGMQKSLKPEDKFKRVPMSYDHLLLNEWKDDVTNWILNDFLSCIGTGKWKRNTTSCDKYNRRCEYYEICETSGVENKLYKLERDYIVASPWDVTAKLNNGD